MRWNKETTMEDLWCDGCAEQGAVLKYDDKVLVTGMSWKGFEAAVYEFIETPEETGLGDIECRLNLIETSKEVYKDGGHAMAWCMSRI